MFNDVLSIFYQEEKMIFSNIKIIKEFLKEAEDCKTEKDVKLLSKKVEG